MEVSGFHLFDVIVLSVMALSAIAAFFRGFMRETLSLTAWLGAALVAWLTFPYFTPLLEPHIGSETLRNGIAITVIYIIALLSFGILNSQVMHLVRKADIGALDKALGFLFGMLRGAFLISLCYLTYSVTVGGRDEPEWIKASQTGRLVELGSLSLTNLAPEWTGELRKLSDNLTGNIEASRIPADLARSELQPGERQTLEQMVRAVPLSQLPKDVEPDPERRTVRDLLRILDVYRDLYDRGDGARMAGDITPEALGSLGQELRNLRLDRVTPDAGDAPPVAERTQPRDSRETELERFLNQFKETE